MIQRILPDALETDGDPYLPGRIPAADISEVRLDRYPPEVVLADGRLAFAPRGKRRALGLFAQVNGLPLAQRTDVWSLLCEPFLDTAFTPEDDRRSSQRLAEEGFSRAEVDRIRERVGPALLRYNSVLLEWVHLGHQDVLRAGPAEPAFRRWTDEVSHRARLRDTSPAPERPTEDSVRRRLDDAWALVQRAAEAGHRPALAGLKERLLSAWSGPGRRYHGLRHLHAVVEATEGHPSREALTLAAFFHDAVYDTARRDNEEQSAAWLEREAGPLLPRKLVESAARLVRSTAHPLGMNREPSPGESDTRAFFDADFAVLASPPGGYDDYAEGVRAEWAHVPDDAFRAGRRAFLERLEEVMRVRGHLFWDAEPVEEWMARQNVARELAALVRSAG